MKIALFIVVAAVTTVVQSDVTGSNPRWNACLCISGTGVNIRSTACGSVIGSSNTGQCFRYSGAKTSCSLNGRRYEFFQISWNGRIGWTTGLYLNLAQDYNCDGASGSGRSGSNGGSGSYGGSTGSSGYTCSVSSTDVGKRIHEGGSPDCRDCSGRNTCKGGQCVALVKCRCTRNGKYPPQTSCWRPGIKVRTSNGKCNRNIPANTAIATFNGTRYSTHAAIFIRCIDDYTAEVYDQWCSQSVDRRRYPSTHKHYSTYATITSSGESGCSDINRQPCPPEYSGSTSCYSYKEQCRNRG